MQSYCTDADAMLQTVEMILFVDFWVLRVFLLQSIVYSSFKN